ncbi:MAG: restriction endonuclease subunit M [Treponema sp.]|uniref:restriction endonuclease subunit M n=1 Tax=Treponema sp. TaxID=166 RepID=UPI002A91DBB5|nr:restriction endonuclease subunit M [Treponema sp.]MDY6396258.1 restriction endonuclease subunit M [Treponema sp.]
MNSDKIQLHENQTFPFSEDILSIILLDRTTGKNILWATDDYTPISSKSQIQLSQITGSHSNRIKPRIQKQKEEQQSRTRNKAEVFTPSWICNAQNNLIDEAWFGRKDVFNSAEIVEGRVNEKKWKSRKTKIKFSTDIESHKTWQDYVKLTRLEITCGEAPYLASRYDTVSGKAIKLKDRIGLLDRKMRVICENAANEAEYFLWASVAFQNTYGFELQGDNLLLARANLLLSFNEYTKHFLKRLPTEEEQMKIAEIISWNLWQMDGLTFSTPFSSPEDEHPSLFEEFNRQENFPCKIMDWKENKIILYKSLLKKRGA